MINAYQKNHPIYIWRKEKGFTQSQVSKLFGFTASNSIGGIERGDRMTNKRHLDRLEALKVEYADENK